MESQDKQKFYSLLEDIYIGEVASKIEGKSGFINIMNIKGHYFKDIKPKIEEGLKIYFKDKKEYNEACSKLLEFFSNYINETGTPFFKDTKYYDNRYVKLYNNKDTELFWKTKDLYYVKSDIIHESLNNLEIDEFIFNFDASEIEHLKNNEKKTLGYSLKSLNKNEITISVFYVTGNNKESKIDNLYNLIIDTSNELKLEEETLEKAIKIYKKRNEVDYFIHKDAYGFLSEQLHLFIYNYLLNNNELDNIYSKERIEFFQKLKKMGMEIISYISKFEEELKSMWEKPKFVKEVNYVITLDRININTLEIIINSDIEKQIEEWKLFKFVKEDFKKETIIEKNILNKLFEKLPLDTKYLSKEMKYKLLESIDNLDEKCDGILIHSDNWQGLNTIMPKYENMIDLCYIDPPFNTGSDFIYKDGYQDSTWLTLMDNRLEITKKLLNKNYSFFLHLDNNANHRGKELLNKYLEYKSEISYFQGYNLKREIGNSKPSEQNEMIFCYGNKKLKQVGKVKTKYLAGITTKGFENPYNNLFNNIIIKSEFNNLFNSDTLTFGALNTDFIVETKQKTTSHSQEINKLFIEIYKNGELIEKEIFKISNLNYLDVKPIFLGQDQNFIDIIGTHWDDILTLRASNVNYNEWNEISFSTKKIEKLLKRIIQISTNQKEIVLDFFSGSGTTINVAQKLNRKWIGIEIGEHFYTINIPRLKYTLFGNNKGISKYINWQGGGFFKYYELEQYEETLSKASYSTKETDKKDIKSTNINFSLSEKMLKDCLIEDIKNNEVYIDFKKVYETMDTAEIAETLSNISGMFIKHIKENEIVFLDKFSNEEVILNTTNISLYDKRFNEYFKSLLYWNNDNKVL